MQCLQCNRPFDPERDRVATICRSFLGGESEGLRGPIPRAEGDGKIALIRQCPRPWSKRCGCDAHRKYFDDRLD